MGIPQISNDKSDTVMRDSGKGKRGVRGLGCTASFLAVVLSLVPLGFIGAIGLAGADCVHCDWTRADELTNFLLPSFVLALAGGILAAIGGLISRSRSFSAGILLAASTAFIALAGLGFVVLGVITSSSGLGSVAVFFFLVSSVPGIASILAFRQAKAGSIILFAVSTLFIAFAGFGFAVLGVITSSSGLGTVAVFLFLVSTVPGTASILAFRRSKARSISETPSAMALYIAPRG